MSATVTELPATVPQTVPTEAGAGAVVKHLVKVGDQVEAYQPLVEFVGAQGELDITATVAGRVVSLLRPGVPVAPGGAVAEIAPRVVVPILGQRSEPPRRPTSRAPAKTPRDTRAQRSAPQRPNVAAEEAETFTVIDLEQDTGNVSPRGENVNLLSRTWVAKDSPVDGRNE